MAGTNPFGVQNVYSGITDFATMAALKAAIPSARSGSVLRLTSAGAAEAITLNTAKPGAGLDIILPTTQVTQLICTDGVDINTRIYGGRYEADVILGTTGSANYGINLNSARKVGIYGACLGKSGVGCMIVGAQDIDIQGITDLGGRRGDCFRIDASSRVNIDNVYARNPEAWGTPFAWSAAGSQQPVDNMSSTDAATAGLAWSDSNHYDTVQHQNDSTSYDVRLRNFNVEVNGQGLFMGSGAVIERGLISDNRVGVGQYHSISVRGKSMTVRDNLVGRISPSENAGNVLMQLNRQTGGPVQAGINAAYPGGGGLTATVDGGSGAMITGGTVTGDGGVLSPELPRLFRPSWAPAIVRPTYTAPSVPLMQTKPQSFWGSSSPYDNNGVMVGSPPTSSQPLSLRPGLILGYVAGAVYEQRWYSNNVLISGQTTRVLSLSGRSGQSIKPEMRAQVGGIWTDWVMGNAVTVA